MLRKQLSTARYKNLFKGKEEEALQSALEARKFEIDLYWKRATYFWTFIGATFAAYAAVYVAGNAEKTPFLLILIACLGFVFSVAWHYVNKGSKFWQENWENHVELLENKHHGPLYKTITQRPIAQNFCEKIKNFFVAPKPLSVSKINQLVSTFVVWIWILLIAKELLGEKFFKLEVWNYLPLLFALFAWLSFLCLGRSHSGEHQPEAYLRKTTIKKKN